MKFKTINVKVSLVFFIILCLFKVDIVLATELPKIKAETALSVDLETRDIIFSKNAEKRMEPASITKLLTALVLSDNYDKDDMLKYTQNAMNQASSSIFLDFGADIEPGFEISGETAMNGLLLYSGNDIATLISDNIAKDADDFSRIMNEKAQLLGMKNSKFYTPNGLDSDDTLNGNSHYTTAYDLYLLSKEVRKNDWLMETMNKSGEIELDIPNDPPIVIKNTNNNLNKKGCIGGKTGFTTKAGRCLLAFYERDGRNLVGIILNSPTRVDSFKDMDILMDYSYSTDKTTLYKKNDVVDTKKISFKPLKFFGPKLNTTVNIVASDDIKIYSNDMNNKIKPQINIENLSGWNLSDNTNIGSLKFNFKDSSQSFNLTTDKTTKDILKEFKSFYITLAISLIVISITLVIVIILIRKKLKNRVAS